MSRSQSSRPSHSAAAASSSSQFSDSLSQAQSQGNFLQPDDEDSELKRINLRQNYAGLNAEIESKASELVQGDLKVTKGYLDRLNQNFKQVGHTREAMVDMTPFEKLGRIVEGSLKRMNQEQSFNLEEIVEQAKIKFNPIEQKENRNQRGNKGKRKRGGGGENAEVVDDSATDAEAEGDVAAAESDFCYFDWNDVNHPNPIAFTLPFGHLRIPIFLGAALGEKEIAAAEARKLAQLDKRRVVRRGLNDLNNLGDEKIPEQMSAEDIEKEEKYLSDARLEWLKAEVATLQEPMNFWSFIIDPTPNNGFQRTVENLFDIAFLVRDGHVKIEDCGGIPMIAPKELTVYKPGEIFPSQQGVAMLDMWNWQRLIQELGIEAPYLKLKDDVAEQMMKISRMQTQARIAAQMPMSPERSLSQSQSSQARGRVQESPVSAASSARKQRR